MHLTPEPATTAPPEPVGVTHAPCSMCGMASSPPWRGPSSRNGIGRICGRCTDWLLESTAEPRALATSVLAGLSTRRRWIIPRRLVELVPLTLWSESGRTVPNSRPWEHVDLDALRARVAELAAEHHFQLPPKWRADAPLVW